MSVADLKAKAKELGIKGYSKMNTAQLEEAIAAASATGSKQIGTVNGLAILVVDGKINGKPPEEFLKSVKGFGMVSPQGARRRVRKLLHAAGYRRLAAIQVP